MLLHNKLQETLVPAPIGTIHALSFRGTVVALGFEETWDARKRECLRDHKVARVTPGCDTRVDAALRHYVAGHSDALDDLDVLQPGSTFHQRVWDALLTIRFGETVTYGGLAKSVGLQNGARAVGYAAAANRIALVVPCHRLVGSRGALTGFAHGIERKRWLLEHEGALSRQTELAGTLCRGHANK